MSVEHSHSRIIAELAREGLAPIGFRRTGRSRTWIADQGWWALYVVFEPSGFGRGTYLGVQASWLWDGGGQGSRLRVAAAGLNRREGWSYESDEQWTRIVRDLVPAAVARAQELREMFPNVDALSRVLDRGHRPSDAERAFAAELLATGDPRLLLQAQSHLSIGPNWRQRLDAAVAHGLLGRAEKAQWHLSRYLAADENRIRPDSHDWHRARVDRARLLLDLVEDTAVFQEHILGEIARGRAELKLQPDWDRSDWLAVATEPSGDGSGR